jgi:hypothetical protein
MAFTGNFLCTSFKVELFQGSHNFTTGSGDTFKIALYTNSASFTAATTDYTATNEISGTGYTAGGGSLTIAASSPTSSGTTAWVDFTDFTWSTSTITARGALIYNTTTGAGSGTTDTVCVLDFGSDRTSTAGDFTVVFPTPDATNAIVRIA